LYPNYLKMLPRYETLISNFAPTPPHNPQMLGSEADTHGHSRPSPVRSPPPKVGSA